ncbi:MAG: EamA family transporter [Pseudomonadota bacterium]
MIDHVFVPVSNLVEATRFYRAVMASLGISQLVSRDGTSGFGKSYPEFWLNARPEMSRIPSDFGAHVCLRGPSKETIIAFHETALAHGGADAGALESVPAVHGAVVTGLAPAATAIIAVLRTGERPPPVFWLACLAGFCAVLYFAYDAGGGHLSLADGWLFLGMLSLGIAYVEGGRVSRELGGSVTLSWAMLFLTPFATIPLLQRVHEIEAATVSASSWVSLVYLGVISMFLASVFWYRGLALGGIARIGQINLLLPLTALGWSAFFLGEEINLTAIICAVVVLAAMIVCLRIRS